VLELPQHLADRLRVQAQLDGQLGGQPGSIALAFERQRLRRGCPQQGLDDLLVLQGEAGGRIEYVLTDPDTGAQHLGIELHLVEGADLQQPAQRPVLAGLQEPLERRFDLPLGETAELSRERPDVGHAGTGGTYGILQLCGDLSSHRGTHGIEVFKGISARFDADVLSNGKRRIETSGPIIPHP